MVDKEDEKRLDRALVKNWLGSPFATGSSETHRDLLYYVRQIREPVGLMEFKLGAGRFQRYMSGDGGSDKGQRAVELLHYEQYLARVELLSEVIRYEVHMRQLVRSHLSKRVDKDDLKKEKLLTEQESVIKGVFGLLGRLVRRDVADHPGVWFPLKEFEAMVDGIRTYYVDPLVAVRDAMCHGNVKEYVSGIRTRSPVVGVSDTRDVEGRAIAIWENIDAVSYSLLSKNAGIRQRLTYEVLVDYEAGKLLGSILEGARYSAQTGYLLKGDLWRGIPRGFIRGIGNPQLKEACVRPCELYEGFVRAVSSTSTPS
jgi:hypothetical protein